MYNSGLKLNILCIQMGGVRGDIENNYKSIVVPMLDSNNGKPIDIIVLPECSMVGYTFDHKKDVVQYGEVCGKGIQYDICKDISTRMNAYVAMGYIEKGDDDILYNSCYVVDRKGEIVVNHRKVLMYDTDKLYFSPGSKWHTFDVHTLSGQVAKTGIGICMDINYKDFKNFYEFPLAEYCRDQDVDCLLFPTAWIYREEEDGHKSNSSIAADLYQWWTMRLTPMIKPELRLRMPVKPRLKKE